MTIIDTTLYANGALRLSRHGAGKGGTVLTLVETGEQINIPEGCAALMFLQRDISVIGHRLAFVTVRTGVDEWQKHVDRYGVRGSKPRGEGHLPA